VSSEINVLGTCIESAEVAQLVTTELSPAHFVDFNHKQIFSAIQELVKACRPVCYENLILLRDNYNFSTQSAHGIIGIKYDLPTSVKMIEELKDEYIVRKFKDGLPKFLDKIDPPNFAHDLEEFVQGVTSENQKKQEAKSIGSIVKDFKEGLSYVDYSLHLKELWKQGKKPGLVTGYSSLDEKIGFIPYGAMVLVGARTSVGKTTFSLSLAIKMMKAQDLKVGIISMEMTRDQIVHKMISALTNINMYKLYKGSLTAEEIERVGYVNEKLDEMDFFIDQVFSTHVNNIVARIKYMKRVLGVEVIIVDYLTKIKGDKSSGNKHLEVDSVSKAIQETALSEGVTIIMLAQLNRSSMKDGQDGKPRKPNLSDFRESGSIEEDADLVFMLDRPSLYDPKNKPNATFLSVAKNRLLGTLGEIELKFENGILEEQTPLGREMQKIAGGNNTY
jgi:replicative DNA helicase